MFETKRSGNAMNRVFVLGLTIALAIVTGCGSSSSNPVIPGLSASFSGSGTSASADMVRVTGSQYSKPVRFVEPESLGYLSDTRPARLTEATPLM